MQKTMLKAKSHPPNFKKAKNTRLYYMSTAQLSTLLFVLVNLVFCFFYEIKGTANR